MSLAPIAVVHANRAAERRADVLLEKAAAFYVKKRYGQALELCIKAVAIAPQYPRARVGQGMVYEALGQGIPARDAMWKALRMGADGKEALRARNALKRMGFSTTPPSIIISTPKISASKQVKSGTTKPPVKQGSQAVTSMPVKVLLDGQLLDAPLAPELKNGTVMVPAAAVFDAWGWAKDYDAVSRELTWYREETRVRLQVGNNRVARLVEREGDKLVERRLMLPVAPYERRVEGRDYVLVPATLFRDALGVEIRWDPARWTANLLLPPSETTLTAVVAGVESERDATAGDTHMLLVIPEGESKPHRFAIGGGTLVQRRITRGKRENDNWVFEAPQTISVADLTPGEEVQLTLKASRPGLAPATGDSISSPVREVLASTRVESSQVLVWSRERVELDMNRGVPWTPGAQLRVRDQSGRLATPQLVRPGSPVVVFRRPQSQTPFLISLFPADMALPTGENVAMPVGVTPGTTRRTFVIHQLWRGHQGAVTSLAWSPRADVLATGSADRTVMLWQIGQTTPRQTLDVNRVVSALAWSPDGRLLAVGCQDGVVRMWNEDGATLFQIEGHLGAVKTLAWSPDGRYLAVGTRQDSDYLSQGEVKIWDIPASQTRTGEKPQLDRLRPSLIGGCDSLAWSPDGKWLAIADAGYPMQVWDVTRRSLSVTLRERFKRIRSLVWTADGRQIVSGGDDGMVRFWQLDGTVLQTVSFPSPVMALKWSPDHQWLAVAQQSSIVMCNPRGEVVRKLEGGTSGSVSLAWSFEGHYLAGTSSDKVVNLWKNE
jgi:WD40 repeat protein